MDKKVIESLPFNDHEHEDLGNYYLYTRFQFWNGNNDVNKGSFEFSHNQVIPLHNDFDSKVYNNKNFVLSTAFYEFLGLVFIFLSMFLGIIVHEGFFALWFLTPAFYCEKEYNSAYFESKKSNNLSFFVTENQKSVLHSFFKQARVGSEHEVTPVEASFIHLVNRFVANKKQVPYYKKMTNYLMRMELSYREQCEYELSNNLSFEKSNSMLAEVVDSVTSEFDKYLTNEVVYQDEKLKYTPGILQFVQYRFMKKTPNNVTSARRVNSLGKPLVIESSNVYSDGDSVQGKIIKLKEQIENVLLTRSDNELETILRRLGQMEDDYIVSKTLMEDLDDQHKLSCLQEEANEMIDCLRADYHRVINSITTGSIDSFKTNWATIRPDESSLNIHKTN